MSQPPLLAELPALLLIGPLGLDTTLVLREGDLIGRLLDTFVVAQLRDELATSATGPRLYHVRQQQGRLEVDLLADLGGGRLIGTGAERGDRTAERRANAVLSGPLPPAEVGVSRLGSLLDRDRVLALAGERFLKRGQRYAADGRVCAIDEDDSSAGHAINVESSRRVSDNACR